MTYASASPVSIRSSRFWALFTGRIIALVYPHSMEVDDTGVHTDHVKNLLLPWIRETEHMLISRVSSVIHDKGLLFDRIAIESAGGTNFLHIDGVSKRSAATFVAQVRSYLL